MRTAESSDVEIRGHVAAGGHGDGAFRGEVLSDFADRTTRRLHIEHRCRDFAVSSADRAFAELAELGRLELVVFAGQPISSRLTDAAQQVREVPRPATDQIAPPIEHAPPQPDAASAAHAPTPSTAVSGHLPRTLITAVVTGFGLAAGARLADRVLGLPISGIERALPVAVLILDSTSRFSGG